MRLSTLEHEGVAATELLDRGQRLVVLHGVGPRIAWFGGVGRENLLYWDRAGKHTRGAWQLRGGHRMWTTRPGADETDETYAPDNAACRVQRARHGIDVTAPVDASGLQKSIAITHTAGEWRIRHRLRNAGDMLWSGGAWALTCTVPRPRTRYEVPLDGGPPAWDLVRLVIPRSWGGNHTSRIADAQFRLVDTKLEVRATGAEGKRFVSAPRGELVMIDPERGTFTKSSRHVVGRTYPLDCNVAIYVGARRFMVELETMSPVTTLLPGDVLDHVETWRYTPPVRRMQGR